MKHINPVLVLSAALLALSAAPAARAAARLPPPLRASPEFDPNATVAATIHLPLGSKPKSFTFGNGTDLFVCTLSGEVLHLDTGAAGATARGGAARGSGAAAAAAAAAPEAATLLATEPGIALAGIQYDPQQHALFVAGTVSGKVYVYYLTRGRPYSVARRAAVAVARPRGPLMSPYVNDVLLTQHYVYATDSFEPFLHVIPRFEPDGRDAAGRPVNVSSGASAAAATAANGPSYMRLGPAFVTTPARLNSNGLVLLRPGVMLVSNFDQSYVAAVQLPPGGFPKTAGEEANATVVARLPQLKAGGSGPWKKVWADVLMMGEAPDVVYMSDNFQNRWVLRAQMVLMLQREAAAGKCIRQRGGCSTRACCGANSARCHDGACNCIPCSLRLAQGAAPQGGPGPVIRRRVVRDPAKSHRRDYPRDPRADGARV